MCYGCPSCSSYWSFSLFQSLRSGGTICPSSSLCWLLQSEYFRLKQEYLLHYMTWVWVCPIHIKMYQTILTIFITVGFYWWVDYHRKSFRKPKLKSNAHTHTHIHCQICWILFWSEKLLMHGSPTSNILYFNIYAVSHSPPKWFLI